MAQVMRRRAAELPVGWPGTIRLSLASIWGLLVAMCMLVPIAIWNKYVFDEANLPLLLAVVAFLALLFGYGAIPRRLLFPGVACSFAVFTLYAWLRLDEAWSFALAELPSGVLPGFAHVLDLIIYYVLFVLAALLYYRQQRLGPLLWFLVCGYIVAFIIRNSLDVAALQEGYNLSPGFVLITLLPFVFMKMEDGRRTTKVVAVTMLLLCVLWLGLIGARTAFGGLLIFVGCLYAWPLITRNRWLFCLTFLGMLAFIAALMAVYMLLVVNTETGLVEGSGIGILRKGLGTRIDIWAHLAYLISQQPWFGYGTDQATKLVAPLQGLSFSYRRDNISSHSTYLELLYRLGVTGLLCFILTTFSVWLVYWRGRKQWVVRVAGAFMMCVLFFCATGQFLVLADMQLRGGMAWIIMGIAAGAALRAPREPQTAAGLRAQ